MNIVISAPSGTGKTSLIKRMISDQNVYEFSVSVTSRQKRDGEIEGKSYYFISVDKFKEMIADNEFVEWAIVHGNYYGTSQKEIDRIKGAGNIPIFDVDIQGAELLKDKLENSVYIFIIPPNLEELERRLKDRKTESEKEINIRLKNAKKELEKYHIFDYIVVNDDLKSAETRLRSIVMAEMCKRDRMKSNLDILLEK